MQAATVWCSATDLIGPGRVLEVGQAVVLPVAEALPDLLADVLGAGAPQIGWTLESYPVRAMLRDLTGHVDRIRAVGWRSEHRDGEWLPARGSGRVAPAMRTVVVLPTEAPSLRPEPGWHALDPALLRQVGWIVDLLDAELGAPYPASL